MVLTNEHIAQAFSSHRFAETYPRLAPNVRWESVGRSTLQGRDAVIEACAESLGYLSQMTTEFRRFRSVVGTDSVAIDSLADYVDADRQKSVVASCDISDFVNGDVTAITSFTVEVGADGPTKS